MGSRRGKRPYRSDLRRSQAAQTRSQILEAAAECFATRGYTGTSLAIIAERAGVSIETVKANGPKRELLVRAFEHTFAGAEGVTSMMEGELVRAILAIEDDDAFLLAGMKHIAEANRRSVPLWRALTSAANSDRAVDAALQQMLAGREADCRRLMDVLASRGMLARRADRHALASVFAYLVAPEGYALFVERSGWLHAEYVRWLVRSVRRLILEP